MTDGVIARYRHFLPVGEKTPPLSLGEGDTPLVKSQWIGPQLGLASLHFKCEGCNPTGSFKDRGMVVAVAKAAEAGCRALVCASTGNTSASAAAYGARCGLKTVVVVPQGRIAAGKLAQAQVFGAQILALDGNFDTALEIVREACDQPDIALVNSINPFRIEGQKTAAFEVVDALGDAPDALLIPVGNAGNISAYWRGFREYHAAGHCQTLPRMLGGQAAGAAPLVSGAPVKNPETVATAIRIGNPASWESAIAARDESHGFIESVTDAEILAAQRELAVREGIFCEPASATSLALLRKALQQERLEPQSRVVCVLTGNGLKDTVTATQNLAEPERITATVDAVLGAIGR